MTSFVNIPNCNFIPNKFSKTRSHLSNEYFLKKDTSFPRFKRLHRYSNIYKGNNDTLELH